jgi:hypothetical protein
VTKGTRLPLSFFASSTFRGSAAAPLRRRLRGAVVMSVGLVGLICLRAQEPDAAGQRAGRVRNFLAQRVGARGSAAAALQRARAQHLAMSRGFTSKADGLQPEAGSLTAAWTAVGPQSVVSATYGALSGRITALGLDPNDATGNTLYVGTTGGGVWKSVNAAGALSSVTFTALTDTLPVFSANAGSAVIPSLSIGALAVQPSLNPVMLAGTGDPNDATDSYYGEGLLRSVDGGLTWTLVQGSHDGANGNHSFAGMAVAGLAFSSATPALVVAAFSNAGEASFVDATNAESVPGLYFSTDAGVTWQMASIYDGPVPVQVPQPTTSGQVGNAVTAVVWDAQRAMFVAAVRAHGYYGSTDGQTWTRLAAQPGAGLTVANCPVGLNGAGAATCPIFRGALAVQAATGDLYALTLDANNVDQGLWQDLCGAVSSGCATPAPTFANRIDNGALEVGSGSAVIAQGAYDLALSAVPATAGIAANGTLLYVGTVDLYRCAIAAGGSTCSLRNTTNALNGCNAPAKVAAAQHAVVGLSETTGGPLVFVGNDGGLWRSTDGVAETGSVCDATDYEHFDNLNGAIGSLAEVVGFAEHPTDASTLLVGLGENGSAATTSAATVGAWGQMSAGEGGFPAIDANTPTNWMLAIGAGVNLKQCALGASCTAASFVPPATVGALQVSYDAALLDAPTMLDPDDTANVLVGTCRVWRGAANGVGWSSASALSGAFDGTRPAVCTAANPLVRSVGAGGPVGAAASGVLAGSEVVYAGMAGALDGGAGFAGAVFGTTTANVAFSATSWKNLALSPVTNDVADAGRFNPEGFDVSSVVVDPHDATGGTVYVTIMGFGLNAGGVPHVYRSVDFGAQWMNVTANLPNAPANAVLVDPNDANTVYVAMDTGVYVTSTISTCAASNCWSELGTALPNAPVISLAAASGMATGDGRLGMLRASTYGRGIWQTPLLTAASPLKPAVTMSASSLTFAAQQVATQSAAQVITVTSSGNAPVVFGTPSITGDFVETDTCASKTIAVNATCTVSVVFAPTVTGARTGLLTIYANVAGGQATVALSGTATAAGNIVLTPLSMTFVATVVNQTAAAQNIAISNTGGSAATLQSPVVTGDFAISANTCGASLGSQMGCTVSITFTPTASGTRTGTLAITDNAGGVVGTQTATLTGVGEAPFTDTLTPVSLTFAQQRVGTVSAVQQVTITNAGDVPLTLLNASMSPGDFTVVNGCGTSLAGHATCALSVAFVPTQPGTRTATLTFTDAVRSQTVAINGVGVAGAGVSLSPTALAFAATGNGLVSAAQAVTLTNNGGSVLTLASVVMPPNFKIAASSCGASLAVAAACTLQVVFAPTAAGSLSGTLMLTDNASPATQMVSLSGLGIDFSLASAGSTTATLSSGASATYPLLLSSAAGVTGSVAFTCTGQPTNSTCTAAPTAPSLGGNTSVTVTVQTGVLAGVDSRGVAPWRVSGVVLALGLPCLLLMRRRRFAWGLVVLCVLVGMSGCGAEREIPATGGGSGGGGGGSSYPTPGGTYNLIVTGTSAGLARSVPLVLVVQ